MELNRTKLANAKQHILTQPNTTQSNLGHMVGRWQHDTCRPVTDTGFRIRRRLSSHMSRMCLFMARERINQLKTKLSRLCLETTKIFQEGSTVKSSSVRVPVR